MSDKKVIGSGSLLIAWQLKGKKVAIIGGGEVASQRIDSLLTTDAAIHVVAPTTGLHPHATRSISRYPDRITHIDQTFALTGEEDVVDGDKLNASVDLFAYDMVLTALDDASLSRRIVEACRARRIPVNAADIPDLCDFYFGGQIRDGPLQIMVSTNGSAPRLAALIKNKIKGTLTGHEGEALSRVGVLRAKLKERAPGIGGDLGKRRMKWMSGICERWSMEELAKLDEETMDWLLTEGWEKGQVLGPRGRWSAQDSVLASAVTIAMTALGLLVAQRFIAPVFKK